MPEPLSISPLALIALVEAEQRVQRDISEREEEFRRVEALEQLHLIVAAFGEPLVLRWVKSVAAMQSGTGL